MHNTVDEHRDAHVALFCSVQCLEESCEDFTHKCDKLNIKEHSEFEL